MFDDEHVDATKSVFVFGLSSVNNVIENHYADTSHKQLLRHVVLCKNYNMHHNFAITANVLGALYDVYPEKVAIINCLKGMLHEENPARHLSSIESTVKLAQLKQFDGFRVCVITEDEKEKTDCGKYGIECLTPKEALEKLKELHSTLNKKTSKKQ